MFANFIRLALAAEALFWLALGAWVTGRIGSSPGAVAAFALAGMLVARVLVLVTTFTVSWFARSPRSPQQRLGPAGTASLAWGEWRAMIVNNFVGLPFDRLVLRDDPPLAADERVPVIVVHGFVSNRGTVAGLARALDATGIGPVFVPSLPAILAPIEVFAGHLEHVIGTVCAGTGQPRVILVCHSMGGLIARTYLATHGTDRVAGLITLGSPHHGSALASLAAGANARQMRVGSAFLRGLERTEGEGGPGCRSLSAYTVHDNLVAPQDSSRLPWSRNLAVHGVGHLAMLLDPRLHRAVAEEISAMRSLASR